MNDETIATEYTYNIVYLPVYSLYFVYHIYMMSSAGVITEVHGGAIAPPAGIMHQVQKLLCFSTCIR